MSQTVTDTTKEVMKKLLVTVTFDHRTAQCTSYMISSSYGLIP